MNQQQLDKMARKAVRAGKSLYKSYKEVLKKYAHIGKSSRNYCVYTDLPDGRHWFCGMAHHPKHPGIIQNQYSPYIVDAMCMVRFEADAILNLLNDKAAFVDHLDNQVRYYGEHPYEYKAPAKVLDFRGIDTDDKRLEQAIADGAEIVDDSEEDDE